VKEAEMFSIPVRCCAASRFALVLLLIFAASGCQKKYGKTWRTFDCGNKTINVNPTNGAEPEAVYVCDGDTVTWSPNGHKFLVEFKKESPFNSGEKEFHNGKPKSDTIKPQKNLKVYEYRITVDGKVFEDPQVLGGGGTP
jgi:plastocyanin